MWLGLYQLDCPDFFNGRVYIIFIKFDTIKFDAPSRYSLNPFFFLIFASTFSITSMISIVFGGRLNHR